MSFAAYRSGIAKLSPLQLSFGFAVVQCLAAAPIVLYGSDTYQSRGNTGNRVTRKIANLIIYGPSALFAYYKSTGAADGTKIAKLLLAHFGKRAVELFVLKKHEKPNSKLPVPADDDQDSVPVKVVAVTSVFYSVGTYLIATNALPMPAGIDYSQALFWMAEIGHSLHNYLLEQSTAADEATCISRTSPSAGGLYRYIVAPHLLFDIIAWAGIALCAKQTHGYTQAALTALLLGWEARKLGSQDGSSTSRSLGQKRWSLIPFVF